MALEATQWLALGWDAGDAEDGFLLPCSFGANVEAGIRLGGIWVGWDLGWGLQGAAGGGPPAHGFGWHWAGMRVMLRMDPYCPVALELMWRLGSGWGGIWVGVFEVLPVGDPQPMALEPRQWLGFGWGLGWVGVCEVCGATRGYRHHGAVEPTAMGTACATPPTHKDSVCH